MRTDNPLTSRGLTWHQRLSYASTLMGWFDSWRTLGFILLPMLTVLTGGLPIAAPAVTFMIAFAAAWGIQRLAIQLLARGRAPLWPSTIFEFIRMPAALKASIALFDTRPRPFSVTDKGRTDDLRRAMPVPQLLLALLGASAASGAWYIATILGRTPLSYPIPWVAHGAALWVLINASFLAGAVYRIKSPRFGSERRAAFRFPYAGSVQVDGMPAAVQDLSITGARVVMPHPPALGSSTWLDPAPAVQLHQPINARVRSIQPTHLGHIVGLEFCDMTTDLRRILVLELFQTGSTPILQPLPLDQRR